MEIYVGFDCDECLAQVTQLMPFTETAAPATVYEKFAELLLLDDAPFIRPTFWPLLNDIAKAGRAVHPFIYSNNGSLPTLEFINTIVSMKLGRPNFFQAIAHYDNPNRTDNTRGQYVKKWHSMKNFLQREFSLEIPIEPEQVMFFDDLPHRPLAAALGKNYQQVEPFELPCVIDGKVYDIDNQRLLELWKKAGGDPALVEVEESVGAGELEAEEAVAFQRIFAGFVESVAGWQTVVRGGRRRKKYARTAKKQR